MVGFVVTNRTLWTSLLGSDLGSGLLYSSPLEPAEETGEWTQSQATSFGMLALPLLTVYPWKYGPEIAHQFWFL